MGQKTSSDSGRSAGHIVRAFTAHSNPGFLGQKPACSSCQESVFIRTGKYRKHPLAPSTASSRNALRPEKSSMSSGRRSCCVHLMGAFCLCVLSGCALKPYRYGHYHDSHSGDDTPQEIEVIHGEPNEKLDRIGRIIGFPARILPMNKKINDHHITPETEEKIATFLRKNDLTDVTVFINEYDPKDQWRRLRANKQIGAGWRYTMGSLSVIGYTLLPGRIFGGDKYNPFTNSLSLNSDLPAVALREAAYAKDVHNHKYPGSYAVGQELPFVGLWSDTVAVRDVCGLRAG